jgi:uncharacterized protein (DUF1330 family)
MPKGYWIPHVDVTDAEGYKSYTSGTPPAHEKYHGVPLVRGGRYEAVEGRARSRNVLREFPDYAAALACYRSDEYQSARPFRLASAQCDFIIVEGYDGPQPPASASAPAPAAKKGYWIVHIDVRDPEGFKPYQSACQAPFGHFGARYLVRGGRQDVTEGRAHGRTVVVEFPSYDAALECYRGDGYQAAKKLRDGKAEFDLVIVEGYDGA